MSEGQPTFSIEASSHELSILWAAVRHVDEVLKKERDKLITLSLLYKLQPALEKASETPYDVVLTLTTTEALMLQNALSMLIADSVLAQGFGNDGTGIGPRNAGHMECQPTRRARLGSSAFGACRTGSACSLARPYPDPAPTAWLRRVSEH